MPMLQKRDAIVHQLPSSQCELIPAAIRQAVIKTSRGRNIKARERALSHASREFLGVRCVVPEGVKNGFELSSTCPLNRSDFSIDRQALMDMNSADYLLLNALLRIFSTTTDRHQDVDILLRNFALSAALNGEHR